jgi:hypothetical protein
MRLLKLLGFSENDSFLKNHVISIRYSSYDSAVLADLPSAPRKSSEVGQELPSGSKSTGLSLSSAGPDESHFLFGSLRKPRQAHALSKPDEIIGSVRPDPILEVGNAQARIEVTGAGKRPLRLFQMTG